MRKKLIINLCILKIYVNNNRLIYSIYFLDSQIKYLVELNIYFFFNFLINKYFCFRVLDILY